MTNHDRPLQPGIGISRYPGSHPNARRRFGQSCWPGQRCCRIWLLFCRLQRENIWRPQVAADLLGHDIITGWKESFQRAFDLQHPGVMEIMENSITDARPVMEFSMISIT